MKAATLASSKSSALPKTYWSAWRRLGHYWRNVFATLASEGYAVAVVNPLRTNRFAGEDLVGVKTDPADALQIAARFALQKRPSPMRPPSEATDELKELVRFRDRLVQEVGDKLRQLHRLVDLGFPEFTRYVRTLDSELALTLLSAYPTAAAFAPLKAFRLGRVVYDGRHVVGRALAEQIVAAAKVSVGRHHGKAYQMQVRVLCEQIRSLKEACRRARQRHRRARRQARRRQASHLDRRK